MSDEAGKQESAQQEAENPIIYIRQGEPKDGYAELVISPKGESAVATLYPPSPGGSFLTYPLFTEKLESLGIVHGVNHDAIQEAIFRTNTTHAPVKSVVVAASSQPVTEIPEHFVIRKDLLDRKPEIDPNAARVDWHSISAFSIVQLKEPIARRVPKVPGAAGMNVYGAEVSYPVRQMQPFAAGTGVIEHEKGLFAGKSGRVSIDSKGVISIEEVLVLKKGVDFTTGNITFPGDVIVQGKIADGFKIYAGGSFVSSEVVDVTEIVCKKDMIVQAGIEGRSKGALRIGGNLSAKYIQNCRVAVRGDVVVSGSIMLSTVYSMGTIKMGDTGKLVGGECIVIGGVQALDIGNSRGTPTRVRCGTDFTVQQELDIANEQLKQLTLKIQKAEETMREAPTDELKSLIESLSQRKAEIANRIPTYLPRIDRNDGAFVEVRGTIFPGVELEICHVPYVVTKPQRQVVFKLDKSRGMIIAEPFKKS